MEDKMASIDDGRNTSASSSFHDNQSFEELKQLLSCASMELESTRQAAKAQGQLHGARVRHLEELLKTARRERDEAREQCMQLQGRLLSGSRVIGSGLSQELLPRTLSGIQPLESVASITETSRVTLTEVHRKLQGQTQDPQLRSLSGMQSLESVASMAEPSRATFTEVHRTLQGQQQQIELQKQLEYVSSMSEPTRDTLTEVHRKIQEQQQLEKQQQLEMHQQLHHHLDLQHTNRSQLDLGPNSTSSHMEFQSQQQNHQLEELRQHLELQHKDHMNMVVSERRQVTEVTRSEVDNGSDTKSTTWNEFTSGVHLGIRSSNEQCMILDNADHICMKLAQGLSSPHTDQCSQPCLDDLQLHLQQQQQQQQVQQQSQQEEEGDSMHLHLHHQQDTEQLLSHMQQGPTDDPHSLHLQDEEPLHTRQDGLSPSQQGTNDGVINMSGMQHSWPVSLIGLPSPPLSNGCPKGLPEQIFQSSCLQGGSVVASILTPLESFGDSSSSSLLLPRPVHLPEPPEADPQVMLNSLPEKGKLLQAVMQAGPLLQTLLLAGPLPQWRHPPPTLDSEEIPRVSMGAASGIMPPVEQAIGIMAGHGSSLEQVMRLSAPVQPSPTQNGFCH